jgi:hypothetical protein
LNARHLTSRRIQDSRYATLCKLQYWSRDQNFRFLFLLRRIKISHYQLHRFENYY